jgi:APA family basic amino acid/polyamine antiporter
VKTPAPAPPHGELLRVLGAGFGLAVVIGGTVGLGILRSPAVVAEHAGSAAMSLMLWGLGGLYALLAAASYADLATSIARSGGVYVYARSAMGNGGGFLFGWADVFSTCSSSAFAALGFAEFAGLLWPGLQQWKTTLAVLAIAVFTAVQWRGVRLGSVVEQAGASIKAVLFLGVIAGLLFLAPAAPPAASAGVGVVLPGAVALVLALQLVLGAYDGWAGGIYFTGEDRDPARNPPRAILGGLLLVILIYLLMNLALLRVLPFNELAASPLPVADAARRWLGESGATLVTAIAAISLLPLLGGTLMVSARIAHAMACDGLLPARLADVNPRGTPAPALLGVAGAALVLVFASGGVLNLMLGVGAFFAVFTYVGGFVSLLVLRHRHPELPRPFRAWCYPWSTWLVLAGGLGLLVGVVIGAPRDSLIAVGVLCMAWPVYRLASKG